MSDNHIPTEFLPPEQQAARRERILAFKKRMAIKRKAREERPPKPVPLAPVYDAVWAEGARMLDEEAT